MLNLRLRVKFRAFFKDIFTFDRTVGIQIIPTGSPYTMGFDFLEGKVLIDERGIKLEVV